MMNSLEPVFALLDHLTPQEREQVQAYLTQQTAKPRVKRRPNLFPGIWMSKDFDDPLPDEMWDWSKE